MTAGRRADAAGAGPDRGAGGGEEREAALVASLDVAAGREIVQRSAGRRDNLSAYLLGGGFAAVAVAFAIAQGAWSARIGLTFVLLSATYVVGYRIQFESAHGSSVPTEPVLVVALFLLPAGLVPAMVLAALVLGALLDTASGPRLRNLAVRALGGWHCLGPVTVFLLFDVDRPDVRRVGVYLLALVSQFALDAVVAVLRFLGTGGRPRELVTPLSFTFAVDALLAPFGLAAAAAGDRGLGALPFVLTTIALIAVLSRDRRRHVDSTVALGEAVVEAREEARIDALTGLANRRAWEEAIDVEQVFHAGTGSARVVSVVLADLDGLKAVNDTVGHDAGDELICALADVLRRCAPRSAVVARVGGDEFAVLLRGGTASGAELVARLRQAIADLPATPSGQRLSASLGTAASPPEASVLQAYRTADKAVFQDKASRRVERRTVARRAGDPQP